MDELPAWEIEAELIESLKATDEEGEAKFIKIRSNFPHTGPPLGIKTVDCGGECSWTWDGSAWQKVEGCSDENCECEDPPPYDEEGPSQVTTPCEKTDIVEFFNPWKKDGLCGSRVVLQYISGECRDSAKCDAKCEVTFHTSTGQWSYTGDPCPEDCECPPLPTDTPEETTVRELDCKPKEDTGRWEIREVAKYKARHIKFRFPSENLMNWWEGDDPESCYPNLNIQYPLGMPCNDCDMIAFYDPFTDSYQADRSPSAVIGEAETMNIIQAMSFDDENVCTLNYVRQQAKVFPCGSDPTFGDTSPNLKDVDVVTGTDFLTETETEVCGGECTWNWNGDEWVKVEGCDGEPPCEGECTWGWDGEKWVKTDGECSAGCNCEEPPPYEEGGASIVSTPCTKTTECNCEPPPPYDGGASIVSTPCTKTKTKVVGLEFKRAVISVCAFMTTSSDEIPITEDCPDDSPSY